MKARKILSIILPLIPIAIVAVGLFMTLVWPLNGVETEGWSLVIFFMTVLPAAGAVAIPCAIVALILNRKEKRAFVTVLSIIDLVWGVPCAIYGLLLLLHLVEGAV